jgi:hypothetical protein
MRRDAVAARSEFGAEWRDDIAALLSRQLIEGAVDWGTHVRAPGSDEVYFAFVDGASGVEGGDSFTCGISHRDVDGRAILDCLIETVPAFDPAAATSEICKARDAWRGPDGGIPRNGGDDDDNGDDDDDRTEAERARDQWIAETSRAWSEPWRGGGPVTGPRIRQRQRR